MCQSTPPHAGPPSPVTLPDPPRHLAPFTAAPCHTDGPSHPARVLSPRSTLPTPRTTTCARWMYHTRQAPTSEATLVVHRKMRRVAVRRHTK